MDIPPHKFLLIILLFTTMHHTIGYAADYKALIADAEAAGHRNITIFTENDTLKVHHWPLGFRNEFEAYEDIRERVYEAIDSQNHEFACIEIIQSSWGLPVLTSRSTPGKPVSEDSYSHAYNMKTPLGAIKHSPAKKLLLQIDIPLSIQFGNLDDPFIFKTGIRPDFRYVVNSNTIAYGQVDLYLHNEFKPQEWYKPANIGILYWKSFNRNILSFTNIGVFTHKRLSGIDENIIFPFFGDNHSIRAHLGYFLKSDFADNQFLYSETYYKLAIAKYTWSYSPYDCSVALFGGRFLEGDKGWGVEISRVFNEVAFELSSTFSKNEFNGNIRFCVPLFPKKRSSRSNHGISMVKDFDLSYHYKKVFYGNDPEVGIRFNEIERYATPTHFRYMARRDK